MSAQRAIVDAFAPVTMQIDTRPPAAGPEWEIRVQDISLQRVLGALLQARIVPLAEKTMLAEAHGVSACCGAMMRVESDRDGTNYGVCMVCGKPADPTQATRRGVT
jgi:hypothetical protein